MIGKKTGGRIKGVSVNKRTRWLQEQLDRSGIDWVTEYKKALAEKNLQMMSVLTELLPYLAAKLNPSEYTLDTPVEEANEPADILSLINRKEMLK
jgi:hypothetical protein